MTQVEMLQEVSLLDISIFDSINNFTYRIFRKIYDRNKKRAHAKSGRLATCNRIDFLKGG